MNNFTARITMQLKVGNSESVDSNSMNRHSTQVYSSQRFIHRVVRPYRNKLFLYASDLNRQSVAIGNLKGNQQQLCGRNINDGVRKKTLPGDFPSIHPSIVQRPTSLSLRDRQLGQLFQSPLRSHQATRPNSF